MTSIPQSAAADSSRAVSEESALVETAQHDPAAFDALYQLYVTRVYRYVRAHMSSDDDAEDLTQQVFLRALDALPAYRSRGTPFGAWLFRIAHHAIVDTHRNHLAMVAWDEVPERLQPVSAADLEGDLLHQEALAQLRPPDRSARSRQARAPLAAIRRQAQLDRNCDGRGQEAAGRQETADAHHAITQGALPWSLTLH